MTLAELTAALASIPEGTKLGFDRENLEVVFDPQDSNGFLSIQVHVDEEGVRLTVADDEEGREFTELVRKARAD